MSNFETLSQVSGGLEGSAPRIWIASTPDNYATITTAGYLNDLGDRVKLNDVWYINYADTSVQPLGGVSGGEASTLGEFYTTISAPNVTLSPALTATGTAAAKAASNNAYAYVSSVNTPTIINQIPIFNDVNGSITDSGFYITNGLLLEPSVSSLTAHAGGGQGSALALTKEINEITTVATNGDSVALPTSVAGMSIVVINTAAKPAQVFGTGTDTINGSTDTVGVSQAADSVVLYFSAVAGSWFSLGLGQSYSTSGLPLTTVTAGITAHAGGGQGSAVLLTSSINQVSTVASAGNSVALPVSASGMSITVINSAILPMQVFGQGTDTINGNTDTVGVSQLPGSVVRYVCYVAGTWVSQDVMFGTSTNLPLFSYTTGITAHAGGGQASAVLLTTVLNTVTTVTTAADSVKLPVGVAGMFMVVSNFGGGDSMDLYPATGGTIGAGSANAAYAIASGITAFLTCVAANTWQAISGS